MTDLKLDIAFWDYDRTQALADGTVKIRELASEHPEIVKAVDTYLRYHFEQGLSKRLLTCEDIFVPELLGT